MYKYNVLDMHLPEEPSQVVVKVPYNIEFLDILKPMRDDTTIRLVYKYPDFNEPPPLRDYRITTFKVDAPAKTSSVSTYLGYVMRNEDVYLVYTNPC